MKPVRVLAVGLGGLVVLGLIAGAVVFNASFQTWAARRALAQEPGLHASLGSLSADLGRIEVKDLRVESHGAVLSLPALDVRLPLLSAALGKKVLVSRLVARGWIVDLAKAKKLALEGPTPRSSWDRLIGALFDHVEPEARDDGFPLVSTAYAADAVASSSARVFRGIFAQLKLPVDLQLDGLALDGEVMVPRPGGGEPAHLHVTLTGGGLAAAGEGKFTLDVAEVRNDGGVLALHAVIGAAMDSSRTFRQVQVKADATAGGPQFPEGVKLATATTAERTTGGEHYTFTAAGNDRQLVTVQADFSSAAANLTGKWALDLRKPDIEPFILGRKLPDFTATGDGKFETGGAWREVHATGKLNVAASGLEVVRHELAAVGALGLSAEFDVLVHGTSLRVDQFDALLAGNTPVLSAQALQPFEFDWRTGSMNVADPNQDLIDVTIDGVPLNWVRPILGKFVLTGGDLQGEFTGSARNGGLELRTKNPLTVKSLTLRRGSEALLHGLDLAIDASADYAQSGWQTEVSKLAVAQEGVGMLSADAKAGRLAGANQPIKIIGHWRADLARWSAQPALAEVVQPTKGEATGELTASLGPEQAGEAKVAIANWATAAGDALPAVNLAAHAERAADGKISFSTPIFLSAGERKSDLLASGTLVPGSPVKVDARVVSEQVYVDDLKPLLTLVPGGGPSPTESTTVAVSGAKADAAPFWNAVNGRVTLALKKAVFGQSFEVANLGGVVRLEPGVLTFDGLKAGIAPEAECKATGEVKFQAQTDQPYALAADVTVTNFDTAPAFRAINPAKPPTIETKLNLTGHLTGTGANLDELTEHVRGDLQLTGRGGIFRGLPVDLSDKLPKNQTTAAVIGGIIGAVTGKKEAADNVQNLFTLAKTLSEIPFDQLSVKAVRTENLDVQLQDFSLIAPELRLTGTGSIRHETDKPLLLQPMNVQVTIGARGTTADLSKRLKLLDTSKQDSLGYSAMVLPVTMGGSLEKPNVNQFASDLVKYVFERSGILNSILGK